MADAAMKPIFPEDGDAGAAGFGDEHEDVVSTRSGVTPVSVEGCEKVTCRLCNAKAMDEGPSAKLDPDGKYGGYWPWAQYNNVKEDGVTICREPIGRVCAPCRNVFAFSGLDAKYKSLPKFAKVCSAPDGQKVHSDFLKKLKVYLESVRDKESTRDGHAARASGQTLQRIRQASLTMEKSRGERVGAPQREFVETANWDVNLDGVFDPANEVEEEIFGKVRKGCWVQRGRAGVWRAEVYDESKLNQVTDVTDNQGPFGEERLANVSQAITDGFDNREVERGEKRCKHRRSLHRCRLQNCYL